MRITGTDTLSRSNRTCTPVDLVREGDLVFQPPGPRGRLTSTSLKTCAWRCSYKTLAAHRVRITGSTARLERERRRGARVVVVPELEGAALANFLRRATKQIRVGGVNSTPLGGGHVSYGLTVNSVLPRTGHSYTARFSSRPLIAAIRSPRRRQVATPGLPPVALRVEDRRLLGSRGD
jgi:hypothetical protein